VSAEGRGFGRDACGHDAAAYALGALEPAEAGEFERHVTECVRCAGDLAAFERVVDELAMSTPEYPMPPGLRRRVMRGVRSAPRRGGISNRRRSGTSNRRRSGTSNRRRRWVPMALATAAAAGLAAAVLAIAALSPGGPSRARLISAEVVHSAGSAQVRLADGRAELIVRHFPAPAAGYVYEVWLKRRGQALEPTRALFGVSAQGAGDIGVSGDLEGVQQILVTQEPADGSLVPTHPPVIIGRLS